MKVKVFDHTSNKGHEQIVFCRDDSVGLRAIIAIHNRNLGPALGGCRMWNYESEEEAFHNALRLSEGMTYKAAMAGLNLGGGKAVIIADPKKKEKREELFRVFGRFVDSISGRYITAEDVGTAVSDMDIVRQETSHVVGISPQHGGSGDPSPFTAIGVHYGMKACAKHVFGTDSLKGMKILVQGLGHVGYSLLKMLVAEGAQITVTDLDQHLVDKAAREFGVAVVHPNEIYDKAADIFCPNALGGIINDNTIDRLKVKIVAGAANNQLAEYQKHGKALLQKGIVYAPDYVINAGGLINVSHEIKGYNKEKATADCQNIYHTVANILSISRDENMPTFDVANRIADRRIYG